MKQTSFWFRHDCDAHQDERCSALIARHGMAGYGFYWSVIERLYQSSDGQLDMRMIDGFAYHLRVPLDDVKQMLTTCFEVGLLVLDGEHFYSHRLLEERKRLDVIRKKRKIAGRKGGLSKAKNAVVANANQMPSKRLAEERRGEKKRLKKNVVVVRPETESLNEYIDSLCLEYGMTNSVNTKSLDIQVQRHLTTGIHLRVEVRKCLGWLIEHGKRDITAQRLANWFEKAKDIQKREQNRLLEPREKMNESPELRGQRKAPFTIDPSTRAKLLSQTPHA